MVSVRFALLKGYLLVLSELVRDLKHTTFISDSNKALQNHCS